MKNTKNKFILIFFVLCLISWQQIFAEEILPPSSPEEEVQESEEIILPEETSPIHNPDPEPEPVQQLTEIVLPLIIENITLNDGDNTLSIEDFPLPDEGLMNIKDSSEEAHDVNARSVLAVLYILDGERSDFQISEMIYYSSFNAFYLKCITLLEEKCDNWLYKVDGESPSVGM